MSDQDAIAPFPDVPAAAVAGCDRQPHRPADAPSQMSSAQALLQRVADALSVPPSLFRENVSASVRYVETADLVQAFGRLNPYDQVATYELIRSLGIKNQEEFGSF